MSVVSFIKVIAGIVKSRKLDRYKRNPKLNERMPNYSVKIGFGLHVGWAIEGAIGGNAYQHNKVNQWTSNVVEQCLNQLTKLGKPFKYIGRCHSSLPLSVCMLMAFPKRNVEFKYIKDIISMSWLKLRGNNFTLSVIIC